jgi:hypothetical protein
MFCLRQYWAKRRRYLFRWQIYGEIEWAVPRTGEVVGPLSLSLSMDDENKNTWDWKCLFLPFHENDSSRRREAPVSSDVESGRGSRG